MTTPLRPTVRLFAQDLDAYQHRGPDTLMIGEGAQVAHKGDWIVTDPDGHKHVFSDAAIRAMCEPIGVGKGGR